MPRAEDGVMRETSAKSGVVGFLRKAVGSAVASEFYIFANGTRIDGEVLMAALKARHAAVSATRRK